MKWATPRSRTEMLVGWVVMTGRVRRVKVAAVESTVPTALVNAASVLVAVVPGRRW